MISSNLESPCEPACQRLKISLKAQRLGGTLISCNKSTQISIKSTARLDLESKKLHHSTMKLVRPSLFAAILVPLLSGCFPTEFSIAANDKILNVMFYPGKDILDDLLIIDGVNYFGKAQYQIDDPLGDIGFRFNDGDRVRAECFQTGKDILGDEECKLYEVYRSDFELIPEGIKIPRPQIF